MVGLQWPFTQCMKANEARPINHNAAYQKAHIISTVARCECGEEDVVEEISDVALD